MPLDGTHFDIPIDLTELQPGKEGLRQLAYLLRHPEEWPSGHVWDFTCPGIDGRKSYKAAGCLYGICGKLWGANIIDEQIATSIGGKVVMKLIGGYCSTYDCPDSQVTPTMVADAIDFFLATGCVPTGGAP